MRLKTRNEVFLAFISIRIWFVSSIMASDITCKFLVATTGSLSAASSVKSSANAMIRNRKGKRHLIGSSTRTFHKKGESTLPCGHPISILWYKVLPSSAFKIAARCFRKLYISLVRYRGHPFLVSADTMDGGQAESNAPLISRNAAAVCILLLKFCSTKFISV